MLIFYYIITMDKNKIFSRFANSRFVDASKLSLVGIFAGMFCVIFAVVYTLVTYMNKRD